MKILLCIFFNINFYYVEQRLCNLVEKKGLVHVLQRLKKTIYLMLLKHDAEITYSVST